MKTSYPSKCRSLGFTLIEMIVTIVIIAIMAHMLFTFGFTFLKMSANQVSSIQNNMAFFQVMENMVADYKAKVSSTTDTSPLSTFSTSVTANAATTYYGQTYSLVNSTPCYATYNGSGAETSCVSSPVPAPPSTLKVQISNGTMTLTSLFTQ